MFTYYNYILKCFKNGMFPGRSKRDYIYYKGMTGDLKRRYLQHKKGYVKYTKRFYGNLQVVYVEEINAKTKKEARRLSLRREKQMKNWNHARIEKLIKLRQSRINEIIKKKLG